MPLLGIFGTYSRNSNFGDEFLEKPKVSHKLYLYSIHTNFILLKSSNKFMCKLWVHLNSWLKITKKSQFPTTFECNFFLKPWVLHQIFFPVAKNSSLCFKLFNKTGVTHNNIYLWVVPKFCLFLGFLRLFHKFQTLFINF